MAEYGRSGSRGPRRPGESGSAESAASTGRATAAATMSCAPLGPPSIGNSLRSMLTDPDDFHRIGPAGFSHRLADREHNEIPDVDLALVDEQLFRGGQH